MSEEDNELRLMITEVLEKKGLINDLRSQLRAAVLVALQEENNLVKLDRSRSGKGAQRRLDQFEADVVRTEIGRLAFSLVLDFLEHFQLDRTVYVLKSEAVLNKNLFSSSKDELRKQLHLEQQTKRIHPMMHSISDKSKEVTSTPVLMDLIGQYQQARQTGSTSPARPVSLVNGNTTNNNSPITASSAGILADDFAATPTKPIGGATTPNSSGASSSSKSKRLLPTANPAGISAAAATSLSSPHSHSPPISPVTTAAVNAHGHASTHTHSTNSEHRSAVSPAASPNATPKHHALNNNARSGASKNGEQRGVDGGDAAEGVLNSESSAEEIDEEEVDEVDEKNDDDDSLADKNKDLLVFDDFLMSSPRASATASKSKTTGGGANELSSTASGVAGAGKKSNLDDLYLDDFEESVMSKSEGTGGGRGGASSRYEQKSARDGFGRKSAISHKIDSSIQKQDDEDDDEDDDEINEDIHEEDLPSGRATSETGRGTTTVADEAGEDITVNSEMSLGLDYVEEAVPARGRRLYR